MAQELKARMLGQTMNEYGCDTKIYLKSEADKVIAELEKNLSEIQSQKMQLEDDVALLRRNMCGEKLKGGVDV